MLLAEILQIRQRHATVERVRARLDDVLSRRRRLRRDRRLEGRVEQRRAEGTNLAREIRRGCERGQIRVRRRECPARLRLQRGLQQRVECERRQKLLRRVFVVVAAVRPEEQRVAADVREHLGRDACRARDDLFEQPFLADAVRRELIVDDRIDGDRCLGQPVRERLAPRVELAEALGLELEKPCVAHPFDDRAVAGRRLLRRLTGCHEWAGHGQRQQQAERHRSDVHITSLQDVRRRRTLARPEPIDSPLILSLSKDEPLAQDRPVEGRAVWLVVRQAHHERFRQAHHERFHKLTPAGRQAHHERVARYPANPETIG